MLTVALVYPIFFVAALLVAWRGVARGLGPWQVSARVALVLYLGWLAGATLFPIPVAVHLTPAQLGPTERLLDRLNAPNIVPLRAIRETAALGWGWPAVRLLAGNVLVFVPFGFLVPAIWPRIGRPRRMLLAGLLLSVGIELSQLTVSLYLGYWYRMADVDDVLLNACGVLLGFALFVAVRAWRRRGAAEGPPGPTRAPDPVLQWCRHSRDGP
jgi:glycopeptide antibiotics resistance protein